MQYYGFALALAITVYLLFKQNFLIQAFCSRAWPRLIALGLLENALIL